MTSCNEFIYLTMKTIKKTITKASNKYDKYIIINIHYFHRCSIYFVTENE